MKRTCLLTPGTPCFFALVAIITLFTLSATVASAQAGASVAPPDPIATEHLGQQMGDWKPPVDYSSVLTAERAAAAAVLANPATKEPTTSLYNGYDRMLAYMQADMIAAVPIEEIADNNFKKVILETPSDPALTNMEADAFSALYNALLVMLHQ